VRHTEGVVSCNDYDVGGRARVSTRDEERVLRGLTFDRLIAKRLRWRFINHNVGSVPFLNYKEIQ